jgi:hypothetical protein
MNEQKINLDEMKFKIQILILLLFCTQTSILFAQTSPIIWIYNSYNINIDTISNKKIDYLNDIIYSNSKVGTLNYTFKNTGEHVTFVDTIFGGCSQFVTKPHETSTVSLQLSYSLFNFHNAFWKSRDTTAVLLLPFYYEGKIYREKVTIILSFGKSKLIEYDNFHIDATEKVAQFVNEDTTKHPSVRFTHYFTIKNISNKPIFCTRELIAWNDAPSLRNQSNYETILPGKTYRIPAQMNMDRKYRFNCQGKIEVFAEGISEIYKCEIISKFEQTDK